MNLVQLRLECLKVAATRTLDPEVITATADKFFDFCTKDKTTGAPADGTKRGPGRPRKDTGNIDPKS